MLPRDFILGCPYSILLVEYCTKVTVTSLKGLKLKGWKGTLWQKPRICYFCPNGLGLIPNSLKIEMNEINLQVY